MIGARITSVFIVLGLPVGFPWNGTGGGGGGGGRLVGRPTCGRPTACSCSR